jgi:site-specific recombinase XerD
VVEATRALVVGSPPTAEAAHLKQFVRDLHRRNLAPTTISHYRNSLERFERRTGISLLEATRDDLRDWLDTLRVGPRTVFWYVSTLRVFYNWALDEELLDRNPATGLVTPRYGRLVPRPIGDDDLVLALRGARPRMRAWLALAAFAGFRAKEIAGLRREDVLDMVEPPVLVVSAPKGGRQRVVPLNPYVAHALRLAGLPRSGWLFPSQRGGGPVQPPTVSKLASRYLDGCGIDATLHQLRHAFATEVYRASRDLRLTQELLGHAHPNTTAIYAAYSPGDGLR